MQKNKAKYLIACAIIVATTQFSASTAAQSSNTQWLLIDERIEGDPKNLSSQLLFADKNSLSSTEKVATVSVSNLNFGETKTDGKFQLMVIDSRMKVEVKCKEQSFKILTLEQHDQDNVKIEKPIINIPIDQWQQAQTPGYKALISFACNPDDGNYQSTFAPNVDPLQGLIGYLNADWSK